MPVKTKRGTVKSTKAQTAETAKTAGTVRITTAKAKSAKAGIGKPTPAKTGNAGTKTGNGPVIHTVSGIKTINLALQGGGSHGAFTWGVLDRPPVSARCIAAPSTTCWAIGTSTARPARCGSISSSGCSRPISSTR